MPGSVPIMGQNRLIDLGEPVSKHFGKVLYLEANTNDRVETQLSYLDYEQRYFTAQHIRTR